LGELDRKDIIFCYSSKCCFTLLLIFVIAILILLRAVIDGAEYSKAIVMQYSLCI